MNAQTSSSAPARPAASGSVSRWLSRQIAFLFLLPVLLFLPAGRLDWIWGWVQVALYVLVVVVQAVILIPSKPGLLAERSVVQPGTKKWDLIIASLAASIFPMLTWIIAGLDERNGWTSPLPLWVHVLGLVGFLVGYGILIWAMTANTFFSTTVRIQSERGHHVATSGPYRIVRHPGYVGAILFQLATPLMLGSWWAMLPSVAVAVLFVVRTALEDRTLEAELPGYADYTRQTRWRLLPGIW